MKTPDPTKGNGPDACNDRPAKTHTNNATEIIAYQKKKATATLIARLALAGHGVHVGRDGGFLVHWMGLSRWCKDFAELQAHAHKVLGGRDE